MDEVRGLPGPPPLRTHLGHPDSGAGTKTGTCATRPTQRRNHKHYQVNHIVKEYARHENGICINTCVAT